MHSLARGLLALEAVAEGGGRPVSASDIAAATGLSVAASRRCIYTLHASGHVRANRNGAVPGPALARLSGYYAATSAEIVASGPILDRLHETAGVSSSLTSFRDEGPILAVTSNQHPSIGLDSRIGAAMPVHCSSAGKLYLAHLPEARLNRCLAETELVRFTPTTIMDPEQLMAELQQIRRQGYAVSNQELTPGIVSVSAPVRARDGSIRASVNAFLPADEAPLPVLVERLAAVTRSAADELSKALP